MLVSRCFSPVLLLYLLCLAANYKMHTATHAQPHAQPRHHTTSPPHHRPPTHPPPTRYGHDGAVLGASTFAAEDGRWLVDVSRGGVLAPSAQAQARAAYAAKGAALDLAAAMEMLAGGGGGSGGNGHGNYTREQAAAARARVVARAKTKLRGAVTMRRAGAARALAREQVRDTCARYGLLGHAFSFFY